MKVWCGQSADQLAEDTPDLVVFPECVSLRDIQAAAALLPRAIVVGAVLEASRVRGIVWHLGCNRIDYAKVGFDGHTDGGPPPERLPIYAVGDVHVGTLVCMDVQLPELRNAVVDALRASTAQFKIVGVPAEMQRGSWFVDDWVGPVWRGTVLALSNGVSRYPDSRLPSFITDTDGLKVAVQERTEPIWLRLD